MNDAIDRKNWMSLTALRVIKCEKDQILSIVLNESLTEPSVDYREAKEIGTTYIFYDSSINSRVKQSFLISVFVKWCNEIFVCPREIGIIL